MKAHDGAVPFHQQAIEDQTIDEKEIIYQCQQGNKQVYGLLVKKYMKRAYFAALGLVASHEGALDMSQDAFVRAFQAINKFDLEKRFFTWYYQILRNLCFNYIRNKKKHARSFSEVDENLISNMPAEVPDASVLYELDERKKAVWRALAMLKKQEREIIILKDIEEYTYKEIASLLDVPIGTVMSRLFTARKALKAKLEEIL